MAAGGDQPRPQQQLVVRREGAEQLADGEDRHHAEDRRLQRDARHQEAEQRAADRDARGIAGDQQARGGDAHAEVRRDREQDPETMNSVVPMQKAARERAKTAMGMKDSPGAGSLITWRAAAARPSARRSSRQDHQ